ncbi:cysteine-rich receptor-like protein kinase 7 [Miscanthus floridulus]|uniref:cysteine-rich receptor-like protein kinase 7 n=1 Tax=Miscanthus floridulus TaxID=154761 RepID=UPI003459F994
MTMEPEDLTFQLLQEITDDFSEERRIGAGSYGDVYKGVTKNGEDVAVKMLKEILQLDDQQFANEFRNLKMLKHQNIVQILGYCYETNKTPTKYNGKTVLAEKTYRALCFEYLHNGSLEKHLSDEFHGFDWHTRYKIIKGTCEGLKHIHEELAEPLYHLDLKPENILLDKNMVPKIADFGLSRIFGKELARTTRSLVGTLATTKDCSGYPPPEHVERGEISKRFDIYSLDVMMIKILTGPEGYSNCAYMQNDGFIDLVQKNWRNRSQATWSGSSLEAYCHQVKICAQMALNCVEEDRKKHQQGAAVP